MKIALTHIRQAWSGGTETYLNQLAAYLAVQGHSVTIICRRRQETPHTAVRFVVLRSPTLGVAHRVWQFARDVSRHLDQQAYDLVYGLGRTWRQDVIRLGGGCHQSYLERSRPHTLSWAQRYLGAGRLKHALYRKIETRTLSPHTRQIIVCNARMVREDIVARYGVPRRQISVVGNGVDLDRFHPVLKEDRGRHLRRSCGFRKGETVLLFLGSGYKRKGLDLLLTAMPAVIRRCPRARLLVVGYDRHQAAFERSAGELGISDRVVFLGGRRDVADCYAASDLYILPTRYDPFANSTLEAMAVGLPVITTTANGGSEVIRPGIDGEVVAPEAASLTEALLNWLDPVRCRSAGIAARQAASRHSAASKLAATMELLEQTAAAKRASRHGVPQ
ncbi:MAG: glycosyltransferase family 4 protein [Desulfosarcinaceae bacterium]|nr:glycosyltransferase family 4 protein [Desulfosarcinaceae bacterium]